MNYTLTSEVLTAFHKAKPLSQEEKEGALTKLYARYQKCQQCPLAGQGRTQVVFGRGNANAKLMFIGEGPGKDEDQQGAPFVGRAGKLLTSILATMNLSQEEVFISNTVKCRPPSNRTPLSNESNACINAMLKYELAIIRPQIVCTLGSTATQAILAEKALLSQCRGHAIKTPSFTLVPTYHPAYLLRNPSAKQLVWEDMQKVLSLLKTD